MCVKGKIISLHIAGLQFSFALAVWKKIGHTNMGLSCFWLFLSFRETQSVSLLVFDAQAHADVLSPSYVWATCKDIKHRSKHRQEHWQWVTWWAVEVFAFPPPLSSHLNETGANEESPLDLKNEKNEEKKPTENIPRCCQCQHCLLLMSSTNGGKK